MTLAPHPPRPTRAVTGAVKLSSMRVIGELTLDEDFYLAGEVIGRIDVGDHALTVTSTGRIEGNVRAKSVVILGEVEGDIAASYRLAIGDGARVLGNITSPRLAIAPGAFFHGAIDMQLGNEFWEHRRAAFGQQPPPESATPALGRQTRA